MPSGSEATGSSYSTKLCPGRFDPRLRKMITVSMFNTSIINRLRAMPLHGSDSPLKLTASSSIPFRSTSPHGGRRSTAPAAAQGMSFDPRPRTGSDEMGDRHKKSPPQPHVSIHAPARGATRDDRSGMDWLNVSIHAPARGATSARRVNTQNTVVSIHAPARGATVMSGFGSGAVQFRSTPPHGERRVRFIRPRAPEQFRSTPPHGERPRRLPCPAPGGGFDPRPRTGSDRGAWSCCMAS